MGVDPYTFEFDSRSSRLYVDDDGYRRDPTDQEIEEERLDLLREQVAVGALTYGEHAACVEQVLRGEQPTHPVTGLPVISDPALRCSPFTPIETEVVWG